MLITNVCMSERTGGENISFINLRERVLVGEGKIPRGTQMTATL